MNKTVIALLGFALTAFLVTVGLYHHGTQPLGSSSAVPSQVYDLWAHWKVQNNKKYGSLDDNRFQIFYQNYQKVMAHQSNPSRTYEMGFTQFMDLTPEEFKAKYLSTHVPETRQVVELSTANLPTSVDWRSKGAVTPIKDQDQCGSCWAFSTVGALEGRCYIDGFGLHSFSEQQLVDCTSSFGNEGCSGGLMDNSWQYLEKNCLAYEGEYPYQAVGNTCQTVKGHNKISGYVDVPSGDDAQLAAGVATQPVSVAADASNWQFYSSGIFSECSTSLDHGVLLVGYSSNAWIVKNSWGSTWGEAGYIRLARGNTCGIANAASYPTKCLGC